MSGHALFATDEAHALAGGGFEGNGIKVDMEQRGEDSFHLVDVGIDFGALGTDGTIDVAHTIAVGFEQIDGATEENLAVGAFVFGGCVGKMVADVAEIGSAEEGVADGVNEYVGIAVAKKAEGMVDAYATQPQIAAFDETMHVIAVAYSDVHIDKLIAVND